MSGGDEKRECCYVIFVILSVLCWGENVILFELFISWSCFGRMRPTKTEEKKTRVLGILWGVGEKRFLGPPPKKLKKIDSIPKWPCKSMDVWLHTLIIVL